MKKYALLNDDGTPLMLHRKGPDGKKVTEAARAGTKGAARRLAKRYGATWRKEAP